MTPPQVPESWASLPFFRDDWPTLWERLASAPPWAPGPENLFRALRLTPRRQVRVVILGQDPYPTPGRATGLAFSFPPGLAPRDSLRNILAEVASDTGHARRRWRSDTLGRTGRAVAEHAAFDAARPSPRPQGLGVGGADRPDPRRHRQRRAARLPALGRAGAEGRARPAPRRGTCSCKAHIPRRCRPTAVSSAPAPSPPPTAGLPRRASPRSTGPAEAPRRGPATPISARKWRREIRADFAAALFENPLPVDDGPCRTPGPAKPGSARAPPGRAPPSSLNAPQGHAGLTIRPTVGSTGLAGPDDHTHRARRHRRTCR